MDQIKLIMLLIYGFYQSMNRFRMYSFILGSDPDFKIECNLMKPKEIKVTHWLSRKIVKDRSNQVISANDINNDLLSKVISNWLRLINADLIQGIDTNQA